MTAQPEGSEPSDAVSVARARIAAKRTGRPVWRTGKPDAVLAAAIDHAREAIHSIAGTSDVGAHLAARTEGDRVVTHLFECRLPGYPGWQWFAVLTRNSRSKVITVNEVGLLPSDDAVLAPEWVPWAQRVRPEDAQPDGLPGDPVAGEMPESKSTDAASMEVDMPEEKESRETPETPPTEQAGTAAAAVDRDVIESIRHAELGADRVEDSGDLQA